MQRLGIVAALTLAIAVVGYTITLAIAAIGHTAALVAVQLPPSGTARSVQSSRSPSYPHLANYNGLQHTWQVPSFAAYDLVIARRGAPVRALKHANSHVIALLYERTLQADPCCMRDLYGLPASDVPPGWWLLTAGSRLAHAVTARTQWIPVVDPRQFQRCQDVLVDGESMHVWSVRGHLLRVRRGYFSAAAPHRRGALIAPHYSYRSDLSNCSITGRVTSRRPWSFNLSSLCPRWHGQTWAGYLARRVARLVRREGWDGVFYDNLTDFPSSSLVDAGGDGRADGGVVAGVNVWRAGERALLAETRRLLPRARIMVNGDLLADGLAAGREMEDFPLIPGLALSAAIDSYLYDGAHGAPLTIVNPDSVTRPYPSMPAVELAVGAALLGDGYVIYDRGWLDHGASWWFDEFDGGAGSATLEPLAAMSMLIPVAHPERFRPGDVVMLDGERARVMRVLSTGLLLERGIAGTLPAWHISRTAITTAAQRAGMRGYLGQPRGPAYLVRTSHWGRYMLPLELRRGPALVDGRRQRRAVWPLGSATMLTVDATVHYDPGATRLSLQAPPGWHAQRTLVFMARGPAGQALWISDGGGAVPLVLWRSWHRYALPIGGGQHITIELGRIGGRVEITGLQLIGVQAFVLRRDFAHGTVLVNPTDAVQYLKLDRTYRLLAGDQNPWSNSGALRDKIAIARHRAAILLDVSGPAALSG